MSAHPGVITFVDEDQGTESQVSADSVPEGIAFVWSPEGSVPVVRVVSHLRGAQRVIRSYGADGALLESTVQAPPPSRS